MYRKNYQMLAKLFGTSFSAARMPDNRKSVSSPFMPLSMDIVSRGDNQVSIALAHNFIMNGDVCPDPDMEIIIDFKECVAVAYSFQQTSPQTYQNLRSEVVKPSALRSPAAVRQINSMNSFLHDWLKNLVQQGHSLAPISDRLDQVG